MLTLKKTIVAGLMAFAVAATATNGPAAADGRKGKIAAGVALGAITGAIIANEIHRSKKRKQIRRSYRDDRVKVVKRKSHHRKHRRNHYDRSYNRDLWYDGPRHYKRRSVYVNQPVYRQPAPRLRREGRISVAQAHTNWCFNRYRSYRKWDNSYQPYHGARRACLSPYN